MAPQTKSFFQHDHSSKNKPQWHRSNYNRAPLRESDPNTTISKPPIPPTSQAKSKLQAFQFVPAYTNATVDQENNAIEAAREAPTAADTVGQGGNVEDVASRNASSAPDTNMTMPSEDMVLPPPQLPHANTFPCTPATRLSLEELIGNSDETPRPQRPQQESPEDEIGWIPNSSSNLITPNRKRKRAKSSSPSSCPKTSSQQQETSAFFQGSGPVAETSPQETDLTASLWRSYAGGKDTDSRAPDLAPLLLQASPRPLETPHKTSAGLRRWASTGNDWPTSRTKRRKTDGPNAIDAWRDQTGIAGKSKVATMVEKLQESLATQRLAQSASKPEVRSEGPSSSSPLPDTGAKELAPVPALSPIAVKMQQPQRLPPRQKLSQRHLQADTDMPDSKSALPSHLQDAVTPSPLHLQSKAPLPAFKRPKITRVSSGSGRQYPTFLATPTNQPMAKPPPPATQPAAPTAVPDLDEFGDDFDFSVEDLDELSVPLDRRSLHEIPEHPNPPPSAAIHPDTTTLAAEADPVRPPVAVLDDDDDDEFGGGDLDESCFVEAEINATQQFMITPRKRRSTFQPSPAYSHSLALSQLPEPTKTRAQTARFTIKHVVSGEYTDARGRKSREKVITVEDTKRTKLTAITLRQSWFDAPLAPGNVIHVTNLPRDGFEDDIKDTQLVLSDDDSSSLLIIHPDHMLSATTVADSFDCARKAVLQDRIKATGETSKAMVYGKILHEIFQQALLANQWNADFLMQLVEATVNNHLEGLWELGMTDTILAVEEIRAKMKEMEAWASIFVASEPSATSTIDDQRGEKIWLSVSKLIAIEEHVWSPRYGLKGNIDVTVQSSVLDNPNQPSKKLIAPFEVKTGRTTNSPAHRAQTALYTLLLSDRYDVETKAGILYYLESSAMSRIAPPVTDLRHMIQQRNRLAAHLYRVKHPDVDDEDLAPGSQQMEESRLPALLKNPHQCTRCYAQQSCFAFHALVENGTAESAGMVDDNSKNHSLVWHEAVGHLSLTAKNAAQATKLRQWFGKWDRLLTLEEGDVTKLKNELWTMTSSEREKHGRCFGQLIISKDLTSTPIAVAPTMVDGIEGGGGRINRFSYVLSRAKRIPGTSFAEGTQLSVGEPIVISSEEGQWALANGYVVAATKHDITVAVDRKLGNARKKLDGFDRDDNQTFRGMMAVDGEVAEMQSPGRPVLYRLDKDEFSNGLALVRNNLVTLMSSHPFHTRLREQVVYSATPKFSKAASTAGLVPSQLGQMNEDQVDAVNKVLEAEDYALILGMPGTGKTTTIAHIIRNLLAQKKSILLTSFTHTAVDNILLKIKDIAPPNSILRLGVPAKVNKEVQKFCQLAATPRNSIEGIEQAYMGTQIVATTCMGTNHAIFKRRSFDVCIVDEASQITLPIALGPLLHARKFVLVGDHYQLPPLVQNRKALEGGLDVSLFRQFSEEHPEAVATLGRQYRMCEDIMALSNTLIYSGRLRCGNEAVANRTLGLTHPDGLDMYHAADQACSGSNVNERCWLREATRPERKVVFANTDNLGDAGSETLTSGKNITNQLEATLVAQAVLGLLAQGVPGSEIGVITLYRSQLALLRQLFKAAGISSDVEIDSADRFQGRDKECILISMVRSNKLGIVGDLLKDFRRVNVALTRARSKLVVFGSRITLKNNDLLSRFLDLVDERRWCLDLPQAADTCHTFNFSSQMTASLVPTRTTQTPAKMVKSPLRHVTPRKNVLQPSQNGANQSPLKRASQNKTKKPARLINGKIGVKERMVLEQVAMDFFEDFDADDL